MSPDRVADLFARLDAVIADAEADENGEVLKILEELTEGVGLEPLVDRYADSTDGTVVRALTFLLARDASRGDVGKSAPLIWELLERISTDDDWARVNLLSALQLASMHGELLDAGQAAPQTLVPFLLDCLDRGAPVQAAAVPVIAHLRADGVLDNLPSEQVGALRAALRRLRGTTDDLVAAELGGVAAFLDEP